MADSSDAVPWDIAAWLLERRLLREDEITRYERTQVRVAERSVWALRNGTLLWRAIDVCSRLAGRRRGLGPAGGEALREGTSQAVASFNWFLLGEFVGSHGDALGEGLDLRQVVRLDREILAQLVAGDTGLVLDYIRSLSRAFPCRQAALERLRSLARVRERETQGRLASRRAASSTARTLPAAQAGGIGEGHGPGHAARSETNRPDSPGRGDPGRTEVGRGARRRKKRKTPRVEETASTRFNAGVVLKPMPSPECCVGGDRNRDVCNDELIEKKPYIEDYHNSAMIPQRESFGLLNSSESSGQHEMFITATNIEGMIRNDSPSLENYTRSERPVHAQEDTGVVKTLDDIFQNSFSTVFQCNEEESSLFLHNVSGQVNFYLRDDRRDLLEDYWDDILKEIKSLGYLKESAAVTETKYLDHIISQTIIASHISSLFKKYDTKIEIINVNENTTCDELYVIIENEDFNNKALAVYSMLYGVKR